MSARAVRAGPRSFEGLELLVRLGAMDRAAWAVAMGWGRAAGYSHSARLQAAGLIVRQPTARGGGSLLLCTRAGALAVGREDLGAGRALGPSTWAHAKAVSWVAAFLQRRGDRWWSERELREDAWWRLEMKVPDAHAKGGRRIVGHRPDLGVMSGEGEVAAYEVELQQKRVARAGAVIDAYVDRIEDPGNDLAGVVYVITQPAVRRIVAARAAARGAGKRVRIVELDWVVDQAQKVSLGGGG